MEVQAEIMEIVLIILLLDEVCACILNENRYHLGCLLMV